MDKIWNWNPSKSGVIGRCGGDEKNTNDPAEPTNVVPGKNPFTRILHPHYTRYLINCMYASTPCHLFNQRSVSWFVFATICWQMYGVIYLFDKCINGWNLGDTSTAV